ncbi:hypothetical protein D3C78_626210 [compost metagenome]
MALHGAPILQFVQADVAVIIQLLNRVMKLLHIAGDGLLRIPMHHQRKRINQQAGDTVSISKIGPTSGYDHAKYGCIRIMKHLQYFSPSELHQGIERYFSLLNKRCHSPGKA